MSSLDIIVLSTAALVLVVALAVLWRLRAPKGRRCPKCGYSLTGLQDPGCPECGHGRSRIREFVSGLVAEHDRREQEARRRGRVDR